MLVFHPPFQTLTVGVCSWSWNFLEQQNILENQIQLCVGVQSCLSVPLLL